MKMAPGFRKLVENRKQFQLHFEFFRHRFDDQFRIADSDFHGGRARNISECRGGGFFILRSAVQPVLQQCGNRGDPAISHLARHVFQYQGIASCSRDRRERTSGRRGTDNCNRAHNQALKTENFVQQTLTSANPYKPLRRSRELSASRKLSPDGV